MLIRYTFQFEQGNLAVDVKQKEEDERIAKAIQDDMAILTIPANDQCIFMNLKNCRYVSRHVLEKKTVEVDGLDVCIDDAKIEADSAT